MPIKNLTLSVSMPERRAEPAKLTKPKRSYQQHPNYPVPLPIVASRHFGLGAGSDQYPATVAFGPFGFYQNLNQ